MVTPMEDQETKYYCRICKRVFGCSQALGGHMRAHGINDDLITAVQTEADDRDFSPSKAECNRTYSRRSNPSREKTCRACSNCGKEFSSWKSFLEHDGTCTSEVEDASNPRDLGESSVVLPEGDRDLDLDLDRGHEDGNHAENGKGLCFGGWKKGKRTKRCKVQAGGSNDDEETIAARCLMMLSKAETDASLANKKSEEYNVRGGSTAVTKKEEKKKMKVVLAPPPPEALPMSAMATAPETETNARKGIFECKACKRVFNSHQALGGHRASHKKVKGCFAANAGCSATAAANRSSLPGSSATAPPPASASASSSASAAADVNTDLAIVPFENGAPLEVAPPAKKIRVHECSVCHRTFDSGQALGGHKRCHWLNSSSSSSARAQRNAASNLHLQEKQTIDLNVPVPMEEEENEEALTPLDLAATALCLQSANNNNNGHNITVDGSHGHQSESRYGCKRKRGADSDTEDEAESSLKTTMLSEIKDAVGSEGIDWLKVGIDSTPDVDGNKDA